MTRCPARRPAPRRHRRTPGFARSALLLAVAMTLVGGVSALAPAVELPPDAVPVPYGPGEKLVFSLDYGMINAGEGTLEVLGVVEFGDHVCYSIQSKASSNRFFSNFYKVRDKVVSFIDVTSLDSRYFHKRLREGDYRKDVEITFDHEAGVARYARDEDMEIESGIHDVLSAFYYVRTLDLKEGDVYDVPAHSSRKNYPLKVYVHGRERVEVPAGTFDCFIVEPKLEGEGLFKHEGKLTLYMTADQYKIPVLMKTEVPVGSIDASLTEYRLGRPLVPAPVAKGEDTTSR